MQTLNRRIRRNSFWKLLGDGSRGLQALFFIWVARHYGPDEFGILSVYYAASLFVTMLGDLGLNLLTTRQIAAHKDQASDYCRTFLALKLLALPIWALIPLGAWLCGVPTERLQLIAFLAAAHCARNLLEFFGAVFTGMEVIQNESALKFFSQAAMLVLGLAAIRQGLPLHWMGAAMAGGYGLAALAGAVWCQRRWGLFPLDFKTEGLSYLYSESLPLILIPAGMSVLMRWDILLMRLFGVGHGPIGWYSAAEKIVTGLGVLPALVTAAAYPVLADLHRNEPRQFAEAQGRFLKIFLLSGALCGLGIAALSRPLVLLVYGASYRGAWEPLALLALAMTFNFPASLLVSAAVAAGRSWDGARAVLTGCLAGLVANALMIPLWGIRGAALASILSQGVLFATILFPAKKFAVRAEDLRDST